MTKTWDKLSVNIDLVYCTLICMSRQPDASVFIQLLSTNQDPETGINQLQKAFGAKIYL